MYKAFLNNKDDFPLKVKDDLSGSLDVSKELWKNGFVKIKKLLNQNQIKIIKSRFKEDLDTPEPLSTRWSKKYKNKYFLPSFGDENATFLSNIVGRYNNVDNVFEGIFNEKRISKVLNVVLGKQYKLWQTTIIWHLKKSMNS